MALVLVLVLALFVVLFLVTSSVFTLIMVLLFFVDLGVDVDFDNFLHDPGCVLCLDLVFGFGIGHCLCLGVCLDLVLGLSLNPGRLFQKLIRRLV